MIIVKLVTMFIYIQIVLLEKNVVIGENTVIYPGVKIYDNSVINENCIIHAGCVIGSDGFGFINEQQNINIKIPHLWKSINRKRCRNWC